MITKVTSCGPVKWNHRFIISRCFLFNFWLVLFDDTPFLNTLLRSEIKIYSMFVNIYKV